MDICLSYRAFAMISLLLIFSISQKLVARIQ